MLEPLGGGLDIRHLERVKEYMDAKKANIAGKRKLHKLSLSWERNDLAKLGQDVDEKVLEALEPHPNLESLCIEGFSGKYFPLWMSNSTMGKIVEIDIRDCQNCTRLPKLGELPHLKRLRLEKMGVEYIIEDEVGSGSPVKIQVPALEFLYLRHLPNLKGLCKEQESKEAFPYHKTLWIMHCSSLILPPLSSLKMLEDLKCSSSTLALLSELDTLTAMSVEIEESLRCFPIEMLVKFSNLRSLRILRAKEISVTREGLQALKELISLRIEDCKTMRCIPEGMLRHLTAMQTLDIVLCPQLAELPEEIKHLENLEWIQLVDLPKMTRLPEALQHLSSLRTLHLSSHAELKSLPEQLPSLHSLSIINCPKLVAVPALPNLKELTVSKCPQATTAKAMPERNRRGLAQHCPHSPTLYCLLTSHHSFQGGNNLHGALIRKPPN